MPNGRCVAGTPLRPRSRPSAVQPLPSHLGDRVDACEDRWGGGLLDGAPMRGTLALRSAPDLLGGPLALGVRSRVPVRGHRHAVDAKRDGPVTGAVRPAGPQSWTSSRMSTGPANFFATSGRSSVGRVRRVVTTVWSPRVVTWCDCPPTDIWFTVAATKSGSVRTARPRWARGRSRRGCGCPWARSSHPRRSRADSSATSHRAAGTSSRRFVGAASRMRTAAEPREGQLVIQVDLVLRRPSPDAGPRAQVTVLEHQPAGRRPVRTARSDACVVEEFVRVGAQRLADCAQLSDRRRACSVEGAPLAINSRCTRSSGRAVVGHGGLGGSSGQTALDDPSGRGGRAIERIARCRVGQPRVMAGPRLPNWCATPVSRASSPMARRRSTTWSTQSSTACCDEASPGPESSRRAPHLGVGCSGDQCRPGAREVAPPSALPRVTIRTGNACLHQPDPGAIAGPGSQVISRGTSTLALRVGAPGSSTGARGSG